MSKLTYVLLLIASLLPAVAIGQVRGNNIVVEVSPDHPDWLYATGQTAEFTVRVLRSGCPMAGAVVSYEAGPEMYPTTKKEGVALKDGTLRLHGTMSSPGFYRVSVRTEVGGKTYEGLCTAGFSPEKLRPQATCPADFDAFWRAQADNARASAPLGATLTPLPGRSTAEVNVYEVSFRNTGWNSRTYGILSVPAKKGKYPALLRVPGAGVRPYNGDTYTCPTGLIVLEIGIHGIPVTLPQEVYDRLAAGALDNYWLNGLDSRERSYYRRVVVGALRAVDMIASLDEWDGRGLCVAGSSQGGWLSLAVAALDKRVSCYAAVHPALCDLAAATKGIPCGWPHPFYYDRSMATKAALQATAYYDGANFARRITVPGWISFGYNDTTVPPTTSWAIYNTIGAKKQMSPYPQTGHYWYQEQWDEWQDWIRTELKIKN